ncbi:MAG: protein-disulfide reductase DsbD [Burkholderiales bacterium PBB6]|nr:MAG: protein-disulfide reductase DsbD [Burkholderiales bacterium PBB6]
MAFAVVAMNTAAAATDTFLPPEQAFAATALARPDGAVDLQWQVAPGYHLYREKIAVDTVDAGVRLGTWVAPKGKQVHDDNLQRDVEVLEGRVAMRVPVLQTAPVWQLSVTSQGCADAGLCYPPQTQRWRLQAPDAAGSAWRISLVPEPDDLPPPPPYRRPATATSTSTPTASQAPADNAGPGGAAARIDGALRGGHLPTVAGLFLLAGLLLSFTPCVLPMVPILSSIIVGQGGTPSRRRGLAMSMAYALGMALVYTALGVAAGLMGEGLAAYLQNPWVLGAFGLLLAGLSLSMFGFYELQLPASWQSGLMGASNRLPGGQWAGVFVMGGLSALMVGPCVAAPLAGALLYIGQTRDVLLGSVALFSLAMGMSVPLLLVGLSAGALLPRAGAWMTGVKHAFGMLLLAVAWWMVSPVLPPPVVVVGWAALALGGATALGTFESLPRPVAAPRLLGKLAGVMLALLGGAQLFGVLSGGRDPWQPLSHLVAAHSAANAATANGALEARVLPAGGHPRFERVASLAELEQRMRQAGKPVLLDVSADWCTACEEMQRFTFSEPEVQRRMARFELLQADVTAHSEADRALLRRLGLFGPPGIAFFDGAGQELRQHQVVGFVNAADFSAHLDRVLR